MDDVIGGPASFPSRAGRTGGEGPAGVAAGSRLLVLWDIDGTLMSCGPAAREALEAGARMAGGLPAAPHVVMSGKTDTQIVHEILTDAGLKPDEVERLVPEALAEARRSLAASKDRIRTEGRLHPGVREVLGALAEAGGVRQTVVTGNLAANAAVKLAAFEIDRYFDLAVGAFGDDHAERDRLVPICLERVRVLRCETYPAEQTWVVGDTERDLGCALAGGVRCLLVGTGQEGFEAIRSLGADHLVEDLAAVDEVLEVLLES